MLFCSIVLGLLYISHFYMPDVYVVLYDYCIFNNVSLFLMQQLASFEALKKQPSKMDVERNG